MKVYTRSSNFLEKSIGILPTKYSSCREPENLFKTLSIMSNTEIIISIAVLVVEDEMLIRLSMVDEFADAGFQVFEASHADKAIAILQEHASKIDVLFTDVNMPGTKDGLELAHLVKRHWPWIGLLVTSGKAACTTADMPSGSRFIPKPYNPLDAIENMRKLAFAAERTSGEGLYGVVDRANTPAAIPILSENG